MSGIALLTTRLISPAASAPAVPAQASEEPAVEQQATAALAEMDAQVDRLHERLVMWTEYPVPTRDPFTFGRVPGQPTAAMPGEQGVPPVAAPLLPGLVAILSDTVEDRQIRTAVFSVGDGVTFRNRGDLVTEFFVDSIGADAVTLIERSSGTSFTLSLR